jgi:hypothetical protein
MFDITREDPFSLDKVAELFDVSRRTVQGWVSDGLETVRIRRLVWTSKESIARLISRQQFAENGARKAANDKSGYQQTAASKEACRELMASRPKRNRLAV